MAFEKEDFHINFKQLAVHSFIMLLQFGPYSLVIPKEIVSKQPLSSRGNLLEELPISHTSRTSFNPMLTNLGIQSDLSISNALNELHNQI